MTKNEFQDIFNAYYEAIRNYIYYKTGDQDLSADIAQDAFIKVWDNREKVKLSTVKSYLYTIAGNLVINNFKHRQIVLKFQRGHNTLQNSESPQYLLEYEEFDQKLQQVVANLSEKNREVFLMNRIDKMPYKDIAEALNISVKAVEKRMTKALSYVKEQLQRPV